MTFEHHKHIRKHARLSWESALFLLVGVGIIFMVFNHIGLGKVISALHSVEPQYIFLVALAQISAYLLWTYKWKILIADLFPARFYKLVPMMFAGLLVNNLTPGSVVGGEPLRAYFLSKMSKKDISECLATTVLDFATSFINFFVIGMACLVYVVFFFDVPLLNNILRGIFGLIIILAIVGVVIERREGKGAFLKRHEALLHKIYNAKFLGFIKRRFKDFKEFKRYMTAQIGEFKSTIKKLGYDKPLIAKAIFIGLLMYACYILDPWIMFRALGHPVPFSQILVVFTISCLIGHFMFVPGGTGIMEASLIAMYSSLGVSVEIAAAVTLVSRLVYYTLTYGIGYVSLAYLSIKYK